MPETAVLALEFLHADADVFRMAPLSMKQEGRAMLLSILDDLVRCSNVSVLCGLCHDAWTELQRERVTRPSVSFQNLRDVAGVGGLVSQIAELATSWDCRCAVVVAPEDDQLLGRLTTELRTRGLRVVSPDDRIVQLGSDKWETWQWLTDRGLPGIPTCRGTEQPGRWPAAERYVVKPVDGAGGEGIQRTVSPETIIGHEGRFIVQPWVAGRSFSIAVLGQGVGTAPVVLPLVEQHVEWRRDRPVYLGGTVRPAGTGDLEVQAQQIAAAIADRLSLSDGYLGIDLLQPESSSQLLVVELNPRFCTSYVGYRQATTGNLMGVLLNPAVAGDSLVWTSEPTAFDFRDDGPRFREVSPPDLTGVD